MNVMSRLRVFFALLLALPLLAQLPKHSEAIVAWRDAVARAESEHKALLVFFRPKRCSACERFQRDVVPHPTISRRMPNIVFVAIQFSPGDTAVPWPAKEPGLGLFDGTGTLRAKWIGVAGTATLGAVLDNVIAAAPHFDRAAALERRLPYAGAVELSIGMMKLGRPAEARATLEEAIAKGSPETRQLATAALAVLDRTRTSSTPIAADTSAIRLLPPDAQVVTGRHLIRTLVNSPAVARVVFTIDGKEIASVTHPPFSTPARFSRIPQAHEIVAVAYDSDGTVVGRDERRVNDGGEVFWIRLNEPAVDPAAGLVSVSIALRAPSARRIVTVTVSWNEKTMSVLTSAPWTTSISVPPHEVGVLRAVAQLDDGRTAEDAMPLNAGAFVERAEVQMVELPVTVTDGGKPVAALRTADLVVQEGPTRRTVESISAGVEAPVTIGMLIDTSGSMHETLPDVQEAAIRFLDSVLQPHDRAFVVSFDSKATLLQPPTADREALRRSIMGLSPRGSTALNDAMVLALLQFEGVKGRRALVVFTDGFDWASRYKADDLKRFSRRMNVPIHAISPAFVEPTPGKPLGPAIGLSHLDRGKIPPSPPGVSPTTLHARRALSELREVASASGGRLHELSSLDRLDAIYKRIAEALDAQMLVTIRTEPGTSDNEWRPVNVTAVARNIEVRAPAGYYAPR